MARGRKAARSAVIEAMGGDGDDLGSIDEAFGLNASLEQLRRMLTNGTSNTDILRRIAACPHQAELFSETVAFRRRIKNDWKRFIIDLVRLPEELWDTRGGSLDVSLVSAHITKSYDVSCIVAERSCLLVVTDETHPLFKLIKFDAYWENRVRYFTERKDLERAWDELGKALRGYQIQNREPDETVADRKSFYEDPKNRCYAVSREVLSTLVNLLHEAHVQADVLHLLGLPPYGAPPPSIQVKKQRWVGGRRQTYTGVEKHRFPGWQFVEVLGGITETWRSGYRGKRYIFGTERAAQSYAIAFYYHLKREDRKRSVSKG